MTDLKKLIMVKEELDSIWENYGKVICERRAMHCAALATYIEDMIEEIDRKRSEVVHLDPDRPSGAV